MAQATKKKAPLVPKLRFKEFVGDGEWKQYFGMDLFENIVDKNHHSNLPVLAITQDFGAIPRDMIDYNVFITDKSLASYKVVNKSDFIISLRSFQGGIEFSEYRGLCSPAYIVLRNTRKIVFLFYKYFFKTQNFISAMNKELEGIRDGKMVSYRQFSRLIIPTQSLPEQQRIADCLTSLDENITAESQKLEALTAHKKALMQKLFPAEGGKVPPLRFKEFAEDGEWEEKRLGSQVHIYSGDSPAQHDLNCSEGCPYIKVEDMNNCGKYQECSRHYVKSCQKAFPKFSVIFPKRGAAILNNKIRIVVKSFYIDTNMMALFPKSTCEFLSEFLYYLLTINKLSKIADTSSVPQINNKHIEPYAVHIPIQLEQQRIADCLASLDEYITAQGQKIALLKEHKKGLMQQLFPRMEEENV